jgi:glyoxylate reductase
MTRWDSPPPERWTVVSTAPYSVDDVRRLLPPDVTAAIVTVEPRTEAGAAAATVEADLVIGDWSFDVPISRAVIDGMTRCRLIQQPSVGYQQIDVDAAARRGIPVANVAGANDVGVAEHTVMVALALMKQLVWLDVEIRAGNWPRHDVLARGHVELAGKTWGVVGLGRIGRTVARRLRGWDVELIYHDVQRAAPEVEAELDVEFVDLPTLLERADVVSLHTPLTAQTHHLIDDAALEHMKPTAYLVNVARGELIDEEALAARLRGRRIRGAALDVFEEEPLPRGHPFLELDNVVLTPHVAGSPYEARVRMLKMTAANLARVVRGEAPLHVVNGVA